MGLKFNGKKISKCVCPACGGSGSIRVLLRKSGGRRVKCGVCQGTGMSVKVGGEK